MHISIRRSVFFDTILVVCGGTMKTCTKCKKSKSKAEFHRHKKSKDGLKSRCKECRNKDNAKHRDANSEYYANWRKENKAYVKQYNSQYHAENKERLNKERTERAKKNEAHEKARKKAWYKKNKDKVMATKRRRRDKKLSCNESYSRNDERITLRAFDYKCFNCNKKDKLHIDHHRPLVKGFGLSLNNAVVLCETCNLSKSTKDPEDFYGNKLCTQLDKKLEKIKQANKDK